MSESESELDKAVSIETDMVSARIAEKMEGQRAIDLVEGLFKEAGIPQEDWDQYLWRLFLLALDTAGEAKTSMETVAGGSEMLCAIFLTGLNLGAALKELAL